MLSIFDFIVEHQEQLAHHCQLGNLLADLEKYHFRFLPRMANDMLLKKILANDYGSPCDFSVAKLCREWVRTQTENLAE